MTRLLLRALILGTLALALQVASLAEGLAQLRLSGFIHAGATGHLVEIEIGDATERPDVVLHLHVAPGTTGAELAALVASRAKRAGLDVMLTPSDETSASLWIDRAKFVNVRLGGGLKAQLSCVEAAPSLVKILPPQAIKQKCTVHMDATTAIVSQGRPPLRGKISLAAELPAKTDSPSAATALWEAGKKEWLSERPGSKAWRPIKALEGGILTGFSAQFRGSGDWRMEVTL